MTTLYPGALDTTAQLKNDATDATVTATTHEVAHNNVADAIMAIELELGVNPSGTFADVASFLSSLNTGSVKLAPGTAQIITPTGDTVALAVKLGNALNVSNLFEARLADNTIVAFIDRLGNISAQSFKINGAAPSGSGGALVLTNSPTISSPTLTGAPVAPTPTTGDNSTKIATTEFVSQAVAGLVQPSSGTLATRPAASAMTHSFYYATDQAVLYFSDGTTWYRQGLPAGATTYLFGSAAAVPTGWVRYDGSNLPASTGIYADLYAHLGNTLTLPDTRGRMPVDQGTHADVSAIGNNEGVSTVGNRRPKHRTSINDPGHSHQYEKLGGPDAAATGGNGGSLGATTTNTTGITVGTNNPNDSLDTSPYFVGLLIAKL